MTEKILIGKEPDSDALKILIDEQTLFETDKYLSSDISCELGGVFTGRYKEPEHLLNITGFIHASETKSSLSRLTFTAETWEDINRKLEDRGSDEKIVGWYHSHPGHSVFLSSYDVFIQENFFNLPFMTAYVLDPTINERAFFIWKDGKIKKSEGYYLLKDKEQIFNSEIPEKKANTVINTVTLEKKKGGKLISFLLILNLLLTAVLFAFHFIDKMHRDEEKNNSAEIEKLKEDYKTLNRKLENFIIESSLKDTVISEFKYTVKDGESIRKIAYLFFNDSAKAESILTYNKLKADEVISGRELIIPIQQ